MKNITESTICFLIKEKKVLLGLKQRGIGAGNWNGIGGKRHKDDKNITETMIRETEEEIGVTPLKYKLMAKLKFIWEDKEEWNQLCWVFLVSKWKGKPIETEEEKKLTWWPINRLPFYNMWEDDPSWLPFVLSGKFIKAKYVFGKDGKIKKFEVRGDCV